MVGAAPHSADPSVKTITPMTKPRRRPSRSASRPKTIRNAAKAML
jgi:hypothetical protein